ncbi:acyltransferase family protein [Dyella choica]|nr:acyltransferase [Dyella choica]
MSTQGKKLAWIQALRGIAALMVVMVHDRGALVGDGGAGRMVANALLPMAMGVDLFFLISGFLMVLTTRDFDGSKAYAWAFTAKRIARIWPLYAIVTLLAIAVDHHGLHGFADRSVLLPYLEGLAFIPHNPAASGLYFQMAVGVAWTLCFECYFYLVFALCMLFGRWRYGVMAGWFALTLIAIPVLRGGYHLGVASQPLVEWSRYANLAINPIVWEFVFGMLAGWLYLSQFTIKRNVMIYSSVVLLTATLLIGWHRIGMVNFFGPAGWGAPLTILFLGAVMLAKNGAMRVPAGLVWLGEASYSLYLVHVYVFVLAQRVMMPIPMGADSFRAMLFVARPVLAVMGAWLVFRYVEAPASAWVRKCLLQMTHRRHAQRSLPAWAGPESSARRISDGP